MTHPLCVCINNRCRYRSITPQYLKRCLKRVMITTCFGLLRPSSGFHLKTCCVYINNRCRYQSITQQYLKRCLIKDDDNYMFRPIAAIIKFSSESMVVVLYRIGMDMSRRWDLNICDVYYMVLLWEQGGGICDVRYPGVCSSSMSACCCPMWVCNCCLSISDIYCWWAFVVGSVQRR